MVLFKGANEQHSGKLPISFPCTEFGASTINCLSLFVKYVERWDVLNQVQDLSAREIYEKLFLCNLEAACAIGCYYMHEGLDFGIWKSIAFFHYFRMLGESVFKMAMSVSVVFSRH